MNKTRISKKMLCLVLIIGIIIFFIIFFLINKSKNIKIGNTMTSQEIINKLLNISKYEAIIEVEVNSNKNTNKYIIKQKYLEPNVSEQEIIEPENMQGIKMIKKDNELKIENTKLDISKVYNNYEYMTDNSMDLNAFISSYKKSDKNKIEENNNEIIIYTENLDSKYNKYSELYINKETGKPIKMIIKDDSKKCVIYILYKEIKFNN